MADGTTAALARAPVVQIILVAVAVEMVEVAAATITPTAGIDIAVVVVVVVVVEEIGAGEAAAEARVASATTTIRIISVIHPAMHRPYRPKLCPSLRTCWHRDWNIARNECLMKPMASETSC